MSGLFVNTCLAKNQTMYSCICSNRDRWLENSDHFWDSVPYQKFQSEAKNTDKESVSREKVFQLRPQSSDLSVKKKKKVVNFLMTFRKCNCNRMKKIVMVKNRFEALFWFWKCKNIRLKNISKFGFSIYLFWVYFITHKNTHFYKPHQIFCKFYIKSTASMTTHASASNQSVNHMIQFLICLCFTNCLHVYFFLIASLPTMSYRYMCQDKIALNVF